jgi:L-2-hydroxyglutarate oxidase
MYRSFVKSAFVRAVQELVPEVRAEDLEPGRAGVRAQAVERSGALVDDFRFAEGPGMLHVLNAPSPAATASLAIGREIAEKADRIFAAH